MRRTGTLVMCSDGGVWVRRVVATLCVLAVAAVPVLVSPGAQAVVPTQGPTIVGTAQVGKTLTAQGATWPVAGTSTFAWYVGPSKIASGPTYVVRPARLGQQITLTETFTATVGGETGTASVTTPQVVEGDPPAPNRALTVTGPAEVGASLVAKRATFPVKGVTTLTWTIDGARVGTGRSYTIRPGDLGKVVRLTQYFSSNGYAATTLTLDRGPVGLGPAPVAFGRPSISGKVQAGSRLKVTGGTWSAPGRSTYAWSVDGTEVRRGRSYVVSLADVGSRVTVTETFTSPGYEPGTVSAQTPVVGPAPVRLRIKVGKARTGRRVAVIIRATSPGPEVPGKVRIGYSGRSLGAKKLTKGKTSLRLPRKKQDGEHRLRVIYRGKHGFGSASRIVMIRLR